MGVGASETKGWGGTPRARRVGGVAGPKGQTSNRARRVGAFVQVRVRVSREKFGLGLDS